MLSKEGKFALYSEVRPQTPETQGFKDFSSETVHVSSNDLTEIMAEGLSRL